MGITEPGRQFGDDVEKTLKDILEESKKSHPEAGRRDDPPEIKRISLQSLKLVRDRSIKYQVPRAPVTSPEHCLEIFRTCFKGVDKEMVYALALDAQNQFVGVVPVAWGTISHVVVHPREVFKVVLGELNAAGFILAHNHPSGNPEPSPEDFAMLDDIRELGHRLDCPLLDFMILGDGTDAYYSHRELHYGKGL